MTHSEQEGDIDVSVPVKHFLNIMIWPSELSFILYLNYFYFY